MGQLFPRGQYYGTVDILFEDANGNIQVLEAHPNAQNLLDQVRNGPCRDLLPDPNGGPCAVYQVTTPDESQAIEDEWRANRIQSLEENRLFGTPLLGAPVRGQNTAHRTPKNAGGCPGSPGSTGNLEPVRPGECQEWEDRLGQHQGARIEALRPQEISLMLSLMLEEKAGPVHTAAYRPHDEYDALVLERLAEVRELVGGVSVPVWNGQPFGGRQNSPAIT
jgi:hypothetical protein